MIAEEAFKKWLVANGAEILPPTNQYEAVRFKGKEIGVVYTSGKTSNKFASYAIHCFVKRKEWDGKPYNVGRKDYRKQKISLLKRDGGKCFLCDKELNGDVTVEHLIPLVAGGPNTPANMVLTHERCNFELGLLTIVEKVKLAVKYRLQ